MENKKQEAKFNFNKHIGEEDLEELEQGQEFNMLIIK